MASFGARATEYTSDRTPLLPLARQVEAPAETSAVRKRLSDVWRTPPREGAISTTYNKKIMFYDHNTLLTWTTFTLFPKSVFVQKPVVQTFVYCVSLAAGIAIGVYFVPSASRIDTSRFQSLTNFLSVFISFMLGIYVQQAFKRWWCSVTTFENVLSSIRQLIYMLHQIRIDGDLIEDVEKLCLASTYILNYEIKHSSSVMKAKGKVLGESRNQDSDLAELDAGEEQHLEWLRRHQYLSPREVDCLKAVSNSAGVMARTRAVWGFIGELLAHMAELTSKTLSPPVETRLIGLCQACIGQIEELKMNIVMQTPFMYAHLLAFLVHVNNFILAASCGVSIGSAVNEIVFRGEQIYDRSYHDVYVNNRNIAQDEMGFEFMKRHNAADRPVAAEESSRLKNFYSAIQVTWIQIIMVCLTPVLHVAFLHIAHLLCYPFGDQDYHLPMETLIAGLDAELAQMKEYREPFRRTIMAQKGRHVDHAEHLDKVVEENP
mmetsp:Transcript_41477/g.65782  ORF Transcript_41477/g.65782 Transcript_41477/m.65782 type:complete len:489 (+) Transcript_41477:84-1550(+)